MEKIHAPPPPRERQILTPKALIGARCPTCGQRRSGPVHIRELLPGALYTLAMRRLAHQAAEAAQELEHAEVEV